MAPRSIAQRASMMDWTMHSELMRIGHEYACQELESARAAGHQFFGQR